MVRPALKIPAPDAGASATGAERGQGRVLVVDDDNAVRICTMRMLQALGYEVVAAADGAEAVALADRRDSPLDILVCDLGMLDKSGTEIARALTHMHPHIKVLFTSGYPPTSADELAAESFLQKPYDRRALARKLESLAATQRTSRLE